MTSIASRQLWQDKIIVDIFNSVDGEYNKEYTLPRGSGVSSLFLLILKEFNIIFRDEPNVKILMIVPTLNHKRFVQSFVQQRGGTAQLFEQIAAFGISLPEENQVKIVAATEDPSIIFAEYNSHIDWLLVDGVDKDNAIFKYVSQLQINNQLIIRTV